jgi:hypothetical protein
MLAPGAQSGAPTKGSYMSYGSTTPPPPPPPPLPTVTDSPAAPPNYLVWTILATVLTFWPLGIFSIVFSTKVNKKWALGDYEGARAASRKAKNFALATVVVWLVLLAFLIVGGRL